MTKKYTPKELRELQRSDPRLVELHPPCFYCKHITEIGAQETAGLSGWKCPAFPNEIPTAILRRELSHTEILPDQQGDQVFVSKVYDYYDDRNIISFEGKWREEPQVIRDEHGNILEIVETDEHGNEYRTYAKRD
jgi:hypothetical protein